MGKRKGQRRGALKKVKKKNREFSTYGFPDFFFNAGTRMLYPQSVAFLFFLFFPFLFFPPPSSSLSLSLFCSVLLCSVLSLLSCFVLSCFCLSWVFDIRYSIFVQTDTTCTQFTRLQEGEEVWNYYELWSGHVMGLPHLCSRDDSKWVGGGGGVLDGGSCVG